MTKFDIQMFAEGVEAAGTTDSTPNAGSTANEVPLTRRQKAKLGKSHEAKSAPAPVIYGVNEDERSANSVSEKKERKSLSKLLEEDEALKKEYGEMTSKVVAKRFGDVDGMRKQLDAANLKLESFGEISDVLAHYYGIDADKHDDILTAFRNDTRFFRKDAAKNGTTEEAERKQFDLERENKRLKKAEEERIAKQTEFNKRKSIYDNWDRDIPILEKLYPGFDLKKEFENPEFAKRASEGRLKEAYEFVHREEIDAAMMKYAHEKAASKIANSVSANIKRPQESAMSNEAAPVYRNDPRNFTKADRKAIREQVKRGKRIVFG